MPGPEYAVVERVDKAEERIALALLDRVADDVLIVGGVVRRDDEAVPLELISEEGVVRPSAAPVLIDDHAGDDVAFEEVREGVVAVY